ncbi:flagellar protein FlaG [Oceanobacillus sp. CFH 90083]|uniref:flagellar protein FlaG n=1 Tax=Oceanobacillus sp. CFH 90083 TaxID=2592336 RepID=UPI00128C1587|nr:flagellar protein FlaG [Oceanobacillus sp. CFH 90083]
MVVNKTGVQDTSFIPHSIKTVTSPAALQSDLKEKETALKEENKVVSKEKVEQVIDKMNGFLEPVRRNVKFEMHEKLEKYYVTVVDADKDEIIREIPPKKLLDMYAEMADFMGLLINKKI